MPKYIRPTILGLADLLYESLYRKNLGDAVPVIGHARPVRPLRALVAWSFLVFLAFVLVIATAPLAPSVARGLSMAGGHLLSVLTGAFCFALVAVLAVRTAAKTTALLKKAHARGIELQSGARKPAWAR